MSAENFRKILDKVAHLTPVIALHLLGEPLLHPELETLIHDCAKHDLLVEIASNALLLRERMFAKLLLPNVRQINFSLHSFSDNYPNQNPETYLKNILSFLKEAAEARPDLYINLRFWDNEEPLNGSIQPFAAIHHRLAEQLGFSWEDVKIVTSLNKRWHLGHRHYLHLDTQFQWPELDSPVRSTRGYCLGLTTHAGILVSGKVVPCCLDHRGIVDLGNILVETPEQVFDGHRASKILTGFRNGNLTEELCQKCTFICRFRRKPRPLQARVPDKLLDTSIQEEEQ